METTSLLALMLVAVPLGMAHALDSDHVLAVSSLAAARDGRNGGRGVAYAARWAIGHGGLLLLVAALVLLLHWNMPAPLPYWAERLVGVILVATGLSACWRVLQNRRSRVSHRHGDVEHAHALGRPPALRHEHAPMAVGMVHGLAGSGPAMALIPATLLHPALGLAYVLVFSAGVLLGMLTFGVCLRSFQGLLLRRAPLLADIGRATIGLLAMAAGAFWLATGWSA